MQNGWMPDDKKTTPSNRPVTGVSEEPPVTRPRPMPAVTDDDRWRQETQHTSTPPFVPPATNYNLPAQPPPLSRDSAARERMRRRRVRGRGRGGEWAWVVIALAMFSVVVVISLSLFVVLRAANAEQEFIPTAAVALPTPVDARSNDLGTPVGGEQFTLDDGSSIIVVPWDGTSRFTIVVAGLDRRPGETGLAYRTDTMMLVSLDPATESLGILSIPRDLYVEVPGYSELQRVNSPMVLGELRQPDYGPQLMMQTVQYNLGIRVHDYLVVDFNTFITIVDAIGGIDIDIPYNISDPNYPDMNYGYDPFYIRAGSQHLDGATALKYARTRHGDNDFARAERQQLVLYAVRDKVLDLNMLPQLVVQAPTIYRSISEGISTGLTFDQMLQLIWYLKDIPTENIRTGVIDERYTIGYSTPRGESVLVPDRAKLGDLMVEVFGQNYSQ